MHCKNIALALAVATGVIAQRPADTPICDYYTTALLKNNTGANQYTLLTLLVNTVVIGNYTMPNVGIKVDGILAPGMYNGAEVNLLPYFNGDLASSNRGGSSGVSVNFLDGGGAAPLMKNMPANDDTSKQYFLLTHLYQFFGALLGCSQYGMAGFPKYSGFASMYEVHKFMDLDQNELGYFITQVAMAAASFGVAQDDLKAVGMALNQLFGMRCSPPATAIPEQGPQLQAICIQDSCPISTNSTCASYQPAMAPKNATATGGMNATMTSTMTGATMTSTMAPSTVPTAGAAVQGVSLALIAGLLACLI
ncbi:hypothetical protein HER10_EVM0003375 [Colletotrichum scovillei]|uniref:Heme haloperoxidase family profile domain-containing protein n=1 Tax=Colletotrichum scovillei TaxID=1209932 RepID=A0A9P7QU22_9PEZI|nr:uncharacterized protein HER10_EVM0003375 [Colletotrichum scovillei]KAF4780842.1 hypothetical protein HER10_EVM0003375 [Colletotrichum scovillei]KAG7039373.1 hypothetical protein JMJ78_0005164 [Colletotrichum scovillei]KAG7041550.1 hypothetical protein JMJ77_0003652 [Colletotrichum scovillei]KAG7061578.1 hypothetical protein JMJ76_0001138 [Colletotrichum scovillei]